MEWDKNLYVGSSISHKKNRIKWKIIHNAGQLDIYVIALASNPKNLLDVVPAWELMQKHYPKKGKYIVGLAGSYDEALEIVTEIVTEVYRDTGQFQVSRYFKKRAKEDTTCISS